MTTRSIATVVLLASMLAALGGCSTAPGTEPASSASSAPASSDGPSAGTQEPSGGSGSQGPGAAATLASLPELAAAENELADEVARAANLPGVLGAGRWSSLDQLLHDALADGGERVTVSGPASRMAGLDAGPPLTAVDGGGGLGLAMAAGLILGSLDRADGAPADLDADLDATQDTTENGERTVGTVSGHLTVTASGSTLHADVEIGVDVTVTDAATGAALRTATFRSRGTIDLDLCPDANGKVRGHVALAIEGGSDAGGSAGMELNAEVVGTVGEDANLQTVDATGTNTQTSAPSSGGSGRRSVVAGGFAARVGPGGTLDVDQASDRSRVVEETESLTDGEVADAARQIGQAAGTAIWLLAEKAQAQWQGGACVEIRATEQSRDVRKNELVQFEATVFHRIEQVELDKPIVPEFAGVTSLDPVGIAVPSPVTLSFKAGPNADDIGTVTLTSTSNRGIGTLDVHFRVKGGWEIDEASPLGTRRGLKCGDPTGPWTVEGTYNAGGFEGTQTWDITIAADEVTGTFKYTVTATGSPGGVTVYLFGSARGKVTLDIDPVTGVAQMHLRETKHTYYATTDYDSHGQDMNAPLERYDFTWQPGGDC